MIVNKSLMFAELTSIDIEHLERDYKLSRESIQVEAYRIGPVSGLSYHDRASNKRCVVFIEPATNLPAILYGLDTAFDKTTGHSNPNVDEVHFKEKDHRVVANFILRYFTDSIS